MNEINKTYSKPLTTLDIIFVFIGRVLVDLVDTFYAINVAKRRKYFEIMFNNYCENNKLLKTLFGWGHSLKSERQVEAWWIILLSIF